MKVLQALLIKLARAVLWPSYFLLLAYAARVAPWPRSLGILVSALLTAAAIGFFVRDLLRWLVVPSTAPERLFNLPFPVARQLDHIGRFLLAAAFFSLLPLYIFDHELIAPEGRPFTAPSLGRLLVIGYELLVWATFVRLLSRKSALLAWLASPLASDDNAPARGTTPVAADRFERFVAGSPGCGLARQAPQIGRFHRARGTRVDHRPGRTRL